MLLFLLWHTTDPPMAEPAPAAPFHLRRFVEAQEGVIDAAVAELHAGRKLGHWMWFVFPQLRGLGRSETSRFYGVTSLDEARAYLAHPLLGPRLIRCTEAVLASGELSLAAIFGSPDDLKFRSSMTLFALADGGEHSLFRRALDRIGGGTLDDRTLLVIPTRG